MDNAITATPEDKISNQGVVSLPPASSVAFTSA